MVKSRCVWIVLVTGFAAVLAAESWAQRRPASDAPVVVDYVNVPSTLEDAVSRADVIVRCRVSDPQLRTRALAGAAVPIVSTRFKLDVVEVLKQRVGMPDPQEVLREGGELVTATGAQRFVEDGFPMFDTREEYLLFLSWNGYLGVYAPAFGPDAAFRITREGLLKGLGHGPLAKQESERDALEVAGRIRSRVAATQSRERQ